MVSLKPLLNIIKLLPSKRKKFYGFIHQATGVRPANIKYYEQAMIHRSSHVNPKTAQKGNNERLEYLGDAILGAIIAEALYHQFPNKNEGFLTKTRAKIVNRTLLNNIGHQMGLQQWIKAQGQIDILQTNLLGDALEALIGAIYVDRGFKQTQHFVNEYLLRLYIDIVSIAKREDNHKSILIEWGQKHKKSVRFVTEELHDASDEATRFIARAIVDNDFFGEGEGLTKKEAQQNAARAALEAIGNQ